jgi:hypothetical protein
MVIEVESEDVNECLTIMMATFPIQLPTRRVHSDNELAADTCDIRRSFPINCTYSRVQFFQCRSCFLSVCLKWAGTQIQVAFMREVLLSYCGRENYDNCLFVGWGSW